MQPKAKVLFAEDQAGERASASKPSDPVEVSAPLTVFGVPRAMAPKSTEPKVVARGVRRVRIACGVADLQALDATSGQEELDYALHLVKIVNFDDAHFDDVVQFGSDLQTEHSAITEAELAIANHPSIQRAQASMTKLLSSLACLNPANVFPATEPTLFQALGQLVAPKAAATAQFNENYPQLLQNAQDLKTCQAHLSTACDQLVALKLRYRALSSRLAGATLAANYITLYFHRSTDANLLREHYASQTHTLEVRATSLSVTRTTLAIGLQNHAILYQNLRNLVHASSGLLDEDLPAFRTAYTAALTSRIPSVAAASALQTIYTKIIHKLKGKTS